MTALDGQIALVTGIRREPRCLASGSPRRGWRGTRSRTS
jgi:hypothetical protein